MPAADLVLTCESGRIVRLGVDLDAFDTEMVAMVAEADRRGWPRPFVVAPAPGRPDGVTVGGRSTTWGRLSPDWAGRRVLARYEAPPLSSWLRSFHGGGMVTQRRGVLVATADGWRICSDHSGELVAFPDAAHVCEVRS